VANDADDHSQMVSIKVWEEITTFKGGPKSFYPWLHKICHRAACSAYKKTKKINRKHVPLLVDKEDDDGKVYKEDNPMIHMRSFLVEHRRELPAFIQGVDLQICQYIRENYSYERIAEILSMTLAAVKMRIARMRKTIEEMRARGELN
jgi:DNA-directed RNA polymerase specialized sigma24 family protein